MENCFINSLTDDCLIKIFLYLSIPDRLRIERVCKRWKSLNPKCWNDTKEFQLSQSIQLSSPIVNTKLLTNEALEKLLSRCGQFITSFTIYQDGLPIDSNLLLIISNVCPNLVKVKLNFDEYDIKKLKEFLPKLKTLEYLQLGHLNENFSTDCLVDLPESVKHISLIGTTIGPFHNWSFRHISKSFLEVFSKLVNLSALKLYGFSLNRKRMQVICERKELKVLTLSSCVIKSGIELIASLDNLEELNLYKVPQVSEGFLLNLVEKCQRLKRLNLNYCDGLTDEGMSLLVKKAKNLEVLDLMFTGFSSSTLVSLNEAVKTRQIPVKLEIIVARESLEDCLGPDSLSELLQVSSKPMMMYNDCIGPIRDYQDEDSD